MSDHPWLEVLEGAALQIEKGREVYQKFTCGACFSRLTMAEPNRFHRTGFCDNCGFVTSIVHMGHNYMMIAPGDQIDDLFKEFGAAGSK